MTLWQWCRATFSLPEPEIHPAFKVDPRTEAELMDRLFNAQREMKRHGIKPLMQGHRGWQKVNPMAATEKPPMAGKVVPIHRKR